MLFSTIQKLLNLNLHGGSWFKLVQQRHLTTQYDFVVIGGSPGGLAAAKEASSLGAKVALLDYKPPEPIDIERGVGGVNITANFVSKNLMHQAALLRDSLNDAKWYGWKLGDRIDHSWECLRHAIQNHIQSQEKISQLELVNKQVECINGMATFKNPSTLHFVTYRGEHDITARYFLIAVGTKPLYVDIFGASEYGITSDEIFSLLRPPGRTMVIGAGHTGMECAGVLNGLGYETTVMVKSIALRNFDQQMAGIVRSEMQNQGVQFLDKCIPKNIKKSSNGRYVVSWTNIANEVFKKEYDTVVSAVGRRAVTKELRIDKAGVVTSDSRGRISTVNEQTNVPHIFAVGDILYNKPAVTPVATLAGTLLARRLFGSSDIQMDYENVPTILLTPLEYGFIGLTEEKALSLYDENKIEIYHSYYKPTEFFIPKRSINNCYLKVIALREDDQQVLGMHYIGPKAGEILQGFSTAIKCNLTIKTLMDTVGIHPTLAEEFTRLNVTKRSGKDPKPASCCS
ncbi:hypothetical protein GWI33_002411 [Rhynchophorus ferrugineus]|uniref:Uncharacterized protein n=1 Tax=Rhynchophorus ferrugineus TaxID=354439 RepID=A0A834MLH6_RHYFE|nr:hypothetical protein GWI33_002411 [Rhynchophorus ferrugineus]